MICAEPRQHAVGDYPHDPSTAQLRTTTVSRQPIVLLSLGTVNARKDDLPRPLHLLLGAPTTMLVPSEWVDRPQSFTGRGTFPKPPPQVLPLDRFGNLHPLQDVLSWNLPAKCSTLNTESACSDKTLQTDEDPTQIEYATSCWNLPSYSIVTHSTPTPHARAQSLPSLYVQCSACLSGSCCT